MQISDNIANLREDPYIRVHRRAFEENLSRRALLTYVALVYSAKTEKNLTYKQIGKLIRYHPVYVSLAVKELMDKGFLIKEKFKRSLKLI